MMQFWKATGLGFAINHVEEAFGMLFALQGQPEEYVEFDTKALMRSANKERIDALVSGVSGGIYSPNEARAEESLPAVKFGDEPRVQQQVVPLSQVGQMPPPSPAPEAPPSAPGLNAPKPEEPKPEPPKPPPKGDAKKEMKAVLAACAKARARFN
jgi:hypothetical protein